jgi:transcription-repair coupling factor (superfamily II helicase)
MSMLTTPPVWRQSISTIVSRFDEKLILEAGNREFQRGGQLFFIHNKVSDIESLRDKLGIIFPKKKIIIAHGQLPGDQLEKRILAFKQKQYDILLATTVIENGIDFSNVNTIFINDAYNFWISQIHQLRWRVWRSDTQWFCYLLFNKDKIAEDAAKRLKTIVEYSHLWAGFELAVKDLEIRGWWDILWLKQSGQSTQVGMNLYLEMLEDKIEQLKRTGPNTTDDIKNSQLQTSIDLQIWAYIDEQFFDSELDKINFYRELEALDTLEELDEIIQDFLTLNSQIPLETQNFFSLLKIKLKAPEYKILSIKRVWVNYQIDFDSSATVDDVRKFLHIDEKVKFKVVSPSRLRSESKNFANEETFLKYMTDILFGWASKKKKIKLKIKS